MGTNAGAISDVLPAKEIVDRMVADAKDCIQRGASMAKL